MTSILKGSSSSNDGRKVRIVDRKENTIFLENQFGPLRMTSIKENEMRFMDRKVV